jgi:hypothetical protein
MPLVYHLHTSPSGPHFGLNVPPASSARRIVSPHLRLTVSDMAGTTCTCGHELFDGRGRCPACFEHQQKRHYRLSGRPHDRLPTPPPSQPTSPRGSLDQTNLSRSALDTTSSRSGSSTVSALNSALSPSSPTDQDHDHMDIFPSHFYRTSERRSSSTQPRALPRPAHATTIRHSEDHVRPTVGHLIADSSSSATGTGTSTPVSREYSPMAAGFAGMRRREIRDQELEEKKRMSQRGSFELAAMMFEGSA